MENESNLNSNSFKKFIVLDESKRGYFISFSGEANTTVRSFFRGLFLFVFTRRITTISSYNEKALSLITKNYIDRINAGHIEKYPLTSIEQFIHELEIEFDEKSKSFWNANSSKLVLTSRTLQRANCYLSAVKNERQDDFLIIKSKQNKNTDNTFKAGFLGALEGFWGGLIGFFLTLFLIWLILFFIVFIVELF
jgi:hypothetical protein